ncbi:hypothetical protein LCGC14_2687600 [marine sediment metagenome]|uniref:Uncharacterized protein n=1 Tax=marine sediment metagenome TaxID=412755 RepID=A0A0F9A6Z9_9ZZZZ
MLGKEKAIEHKNVYDQYSQKLLDQFQVMIAGSLFMTYSLYLIFKFNLFIPEIASINENFVIITIPIFLYIIMRFMYLTSAKPEIARNTEKAFKDRGILIAAVLILLFLLYSFYFDTIVLFLNL